MQGAHAEPGVAANVAHELAAELCVMAGWLGLERIEASGAGDLSPALALARSSGPQ